MNESRLMYCITAVVMTAKGPMHSYNTATVMIVLSCHDSMCTLKLALVALPVCYGCPCRLVVDSIVTIPQVLPLDIKTLQRGFFGHVSMIGV